MLAYQMRLALLSLKRNPLLSLLMVGGIGLGIAVAMVFVTAYYWFSGDPIPHKSDKLFYVQLDAWDPESPYDDETNEPPSQITYPDMVGIMKTDIPTHQSGMYKTQLTIHPPKQGERPYREIVRMCFADFFPMFDVPFRYGSGWGPSADAGPEPVVVIDFKMNQKLFGGENSVGRSLRIEDREFRVVGVLEPWRPFIKYYDILNSEFVEPESVFMPFRFGPAMEIYSAGNTSGWKPYDGDEHEDFLQSESVWIQMWAQLDDERQVEEYKAFLDAYALDQKKLGRFGRPLNNRVRPVMEWLKSEQVVPEEATALLIIALLFLLICSVNLIGILLGKFLARSPEVGLRRALGASRRWVFVQHLIECEMVGVVGGLVGLMLAAAAMRPLGRLFDDEFQFALDVNMYFVGLGLALLAAMVAGVYPAWRICRIPPGEHLKTQ
jgi:putative ABC transport system permease protein